MIPRVVLDTSVLLGPQRHELVFLAKNGLFTFVWSPFLIAELVRIRTEWGIKHQQDREIYRARINKLIHLLTQIAEVVDYTLIEGGNYNEWLRDPDDEPLLATALAGKASIIVSANTRDFPPRGSFAGVRYCTPLQFLSDVYAEHPEKAMQVIFKGVGFRIPELPIRAAEHDGDVAATQGARARERLLRHHDARR
jgi:predicted nucleic acid-binding protein